MHKFRGLGHKIYISILNKIFIYLINLIHRLNKNIYIMLFYCLYFLKKLIFHVKMRINNYDLTFCLLF